jgi:glutathione S-transferase
MKLFGHPDSGHALKVKFYLQWLNIEHDYELVDIFSDPCNRSSEFLNVSRFAEVPTLIDESRSYIQSNAILVYLAEKYDQFANAAEKQRCLEWLVWEANKIGMCLPQLRAHDFLGEAYPAFRLSVGAYEWLMKRYQHDVSVLNEALADKAFILGDVVSPADFSLSGYLMYADQVNVEMPNNVKGWLQRLQSEQGWQNPYEMLQG